MTTNPLYDGLLSSLYDKSWYGICKQEEIDFFLSHTADKNTLEIGSGTGRISIPLLNAGCNLYGIEGSEAMLQNLLSNPELKAEDKKRFMLWNLLNVPLPIEDETYDCIIVPFSTYALIHHKAMTTSFDNRLMKELYRIMKPGGILIINDWRTQVEDKEKLLHAPEYLVETLPQGLLEIEHETYYQCPNKLFPEQIIKLRHSIFLKNNKIVEENIEELPFWDIADFPILGEDAGFNYLLHEYCEFHLLPSVHHFFQKSTEIFFIQNHKNT